MAKAGTVCHTVSPQEKEKEKEKDPFAGASPGDQKTASPESKKPKSKTADEPPRPRNLLFDAIVEVTGLDPSVKSNGSHIGSIAAELSQAKSPYTPDDVRRFAAEFWKHCPYAAKDQRRIPTPKEIAKNICKIRGSPCGFTTEAIG